MTYEEIQNTLEKVGLPVAFYSFDEVQTGDFIAFLTEDVDESFGNNETLGVAIQIRVELYTRQKDIAVEEKLEEVLTEIYPSWTTDPEQWLPTEQMFYKKYYFSFWQQKGK